MSPAPNPFRRRDSIHHSFLPQVFVEFFSSTVLLSLLPFLCHSDHAPVRARVVLVVVVAPFFLESLLLHLDFKILAPSLVNVVFPFRRPSTMFTQCLSQPRRTFLKLSLHLNRSVLLKEEKFSTRVLCRSESESCKRKRASGRLLSLHSDGLRTTEVALAALLRAGCAVGARAGRVLQCC